jgi:Zn-dependent peptidase ImmA (M78 family)
MAISGYIGTNQLEKLVKYKIKSLGVTEDDYPLDPYLLIEKENILLQFTPFDNDDIRGMLVHGPSLSGIMINSNRSDTSKRFIAAHELAHYWFHPHEGKTVCFEHYSDRSRGIEWQANHAAAYALMPSKMLIESYEYCEGDLSFLCDYFQVSKDSLNFRLKELGLKKKVNRYQIYDENDLVLNLLEDEWLYGGL